MYLETFRVLEPCIPTPRSRLSWSRTSISLFEYSGSRISISRFGYSGPPYIHFKPLVSNSKLWRQQLLHYMFLISSTNFRYVKYVHNLSINLFLIQHITSLHIDYVFVGLCISFWSLTIHNESLILLSTISKFSLQVVYIPHIKLTIMSSNSYRYIILPNRTNHDLRIRNMNFFPKICMWYRYQRKSGTGWDLYR